MFWQKYGVLVIQEILAVLNIITGFIVLCLGWIILRVDPSNPFISQGSSIFTALGLTLIFFGLGLVYTYYKDFKSDQDTAKIQRTLTRIEKQNDLIMAHFNLSLLPSDEKNESNPPRISDRVAYFSPIIIILILANFSYIEGNLILSGGLTVVAFVMVIKPIL
jgi:hypothetical protein